jgi:hypothetical protein
MTGFGLVIVYIETLQLVNITLSLPYIRKLPYLVLGPLSLSVFTSRFSAAAFRGERSLSSGFPNFPWPQLRACHSH